MRNITKILIGACMTLLPMAAGCDQGIPENSVKTGTDKPGTPGQSAAVKPVDGAQGGSAVNPHGGDSGSVDGTHGAVQPSNSNPK